MYDSSLVWKSRVSAANPGSWELAFRTGIPRVVRALWPPGEGRAHPSLLYPTPTSSLPHHALNTEPSPHWVLEMYGLEMYLNHQKQFVFELCPITVNRFGQPFSWRGLLRFHYPGTGAHIMNLDLASGRTSGWGHLPASCEPQLSGGGRARKLHG